MILEVNNSYAIVRRSTTEEQRWLHGQLQTGYMESLYDTSTGEFPSGFIPIIQEFAKKEGVHLGFIDTRKITCAPNPNANLMFLRPYQKNTVDTIVLNKRGIIHACSSAGKLQLPIALSIAVPCRWVYISHAASTARHVAEAGKDATGTTYTVTDATIRSASTNITYTTYQAIRNKPALKRYLLSTAEGIILDDITMASAKTFAAVLKHAKHAYYRVGISPRSINNSNNRHAMMIGVVGPQMHKLSPLSLVKTTSSTTFRVTLVRYSDARLPHLDYNWDSAYQQCVMMCQERIRAMCHVCQSARKPILVCVTNPTHGHALAAAMTREGIATTNISGRLSGDDRMRILKQLGEGTLKAAIVTNSTLETLGLNTVRSVILAGGAQTQTDCLDILRQEVTHTDNDPEIQVFDFLDTQTRLLAQKASNRVRAYKHRGYHTTTIDISSRKRETGINACVQTATRAS